MRYQIIVVISLLFMSISAAQADWTDVLKGLFGKEEPAPATEKQPATPATQAAPGQSDMNQAVLDALAVGVQRAIEYLGKEGGYLNDAQVKIPMPDTLATIEKIARKLGQEKYADRFIASMNHAAERAVPKTTQIFLDTIKNMSVQDAQAIVTGSNDAATRYFQEKTSDQLREVIKPLVSESMNEVGVTSAYKKLIGKTEFLSGYIDPESLDLDTYVTDKTLDGLFLKLAEEEGKIRADPVARTTDILKKVFDYYSR
jgi:hypothetical protein